MTGSGEREDGVAGDEGSAELRMAIQRAAKAQARAAKDAKRAAKAEAKAARQAEKAARRLARKTAKAEAKTRKRAAKKARRADAKASKAAAKAAKQAARTISLAVAQAGALLEAAADLIREGQPEAPVASAEPMPEPQPDAESDGEPLASTVPVSEAALEHEAAREHDAEPVPAPEPAQELEPQPEAGAEPQTKPADEVLPAPEPEPEPEPELRPVAGAVEEPEAAPHAEVAPEPEPGPEAQADREPAGEPATVADDETAPEPAVELTAEPEPTAPRIEAVAGLTVAASIDVGATSVHVLVGTVDGHRVTPLLDESVFLGLGDRVADAGYLGEDVRAVLVADLERYAAAARELGASSVTIVGTEPLRRAADPAALVGEVERRVGAPVHVLDHAEEGLLTLIGATGGSPVSGELLLADIGGGSSELVVVGRDGRPRAVGLPLGASRLTRDLVRSDPPSLSDIEALRRAVARIIVDAPAASPTEIVAVGGTTSNLLRLLPATAVDRALTRRRIAVALAMLTVERSTEAAARHLVRPERARILPAGAIIADAILERYGADRLRVSESGIREGVVLAAVHGGAAWRDRLAPMARGWVEPA